MSSRAIVVDASLPLMCSSCVNPDNFDENFCNLCKRITAIKRARDESRDSLLRQAKYMKQKSDSNFSNPEVGDDVSHAKNLPPRQNFWQVNQNHTAAARVCYMAEDWRVPDQQLHTGSQDRQPGWLPV